MRVRRLPLGRELREYELRFVVFLAVVPRVDALRPERLVVVREDVMRADELREVELREDEVRADAPRFVVPLAVERFCGARFLEEAAFDPRLVG